jgi:hypothetical protein
MCLGAPPMTDAWIDRVVPFGDASGRGPLCIEAETQSRWLTLAQQGPSGARLSPSTLVSRTQLPTLLFGLFLRPNNVANPSVHTHSLTQPRAVPSRLQSVRHTRLATDSHLSWLRQTTTTHNPHPCLPMYHQPCQVTNHRHPLLQPHMHLLRPRR